MIYCGFVFRCYVYRSWGRVGTSIGADKLEAMQKQDAVAHFKDLYEEKSGNRWGQKKEFIKYPKKFYPLEMDYGQVCLLESLYSMYHHLFYKTFLSLLLLHRTFFCS